MTKIHYNRLNNTETSSTKRIPSFLQDDYPYKACKEIITQPDSIQPDLVYEIKCSICEMSIRTQGVNIQSTYKRIVSKDGCIGCGNKDIIIRQIDMTKASKK